MTLTRRCAQCGEYALEPLILNGLPLCDSCADDLPQKGRQEGIRQPRIDRRRLAREDRIRSDRGW